MISHYAMAVLSVAMAIIAAELINTLLHAEPIASSMLCGCYFRCMVWRFWACTVGDHTRSLAFHYYLVPPINSFTWKHDLFAVGISEVPRLIPVFHYISLCCIHDFGTEKSNRNSRALRDDLQAAVEDQKRIEGALLHSEMYLTEAQKLSRTGSFGWNVSSGQIFLVRRNLPNFPM